MSYALGVVAAIALTMLARCLAKRWPVVLASLGFLVGALLVAYAVSLLMNPYVGELHGGIIALFAIVALYLGVMTVLLERPLWRAAGIALSYLGLLALVLSVTANLRDAIGRDLYPKNMAASEAWSDACDTFSNSFVIGWLCLLLIGAVVDRLSARRPSRA